MTWDRIGIRESSASCVLSLRTTKRITFAFLLLLFGSSLGFGQSSSHRCEVTAIDNNTDSMSKLGSFTTVVESEQPITKAFRFPGTELFVITSVLYMQEAPFAKGVPPSEIILTLFLGKKAYSEIEAERRVSTIMRHRPIGI